MWNGAWPPSSGSGNTSWMTSAPPTSTHLAQPSKSRCAASSVCPPSMNKNRNGVRQPRATTGDLPTTATTWSSRSAASRVWRSVGSVSNSPVTGSTSDGVVVLPAGLVLLGAVMVVDGVEHAAGLLGGGAEHHRRLAAVGADLDADAVAEIAQRGVVERAALVGGHEAGDLIGECEQPAAGRAGVSVSLIGVQLTVAGEPGCSSVRTCVRSGPGVDSAPADRQAGRHRRPPRARRRRAPQP